jgi:excisionase family DNA binding protein
MAKASITALPQLSEQEKSFLKMIDPREREPDPVAYSVREVARAIRVSTKFVRERIADKSLSALKVDGKRWRITPQSLQSFLRTRPTNTK